MSKPAALRTCVACRKKANKEEFIKVVKTPDGVKVDASGRSDGRGAYVCKNGECVALAKKKRAFDRSFKGKVSEEVYEELEKLVENN